MSKKAMKLALEAAYLAGFNASGEGYNGEYGIDCPEENAIWKKDRDNALREALADHSKQHLDMVAEQPAPQKPIIKSYLKKDNSQPVKWSDYEPDGMHHNKPQKRPQNCGTGYCSCIECVMEPEQPIIKSYPEKDNSAQRTWVGLVWGNLPEDGQNHDFLRGAVWAEAKLKEKNT